MNKKKKILLITVPAVLIILLIIFTRKSSSEMNCITAKVSRGAFSSLVFSSGQLESEKSENINIPEKLKDRNLRIWELAITDMIDEGTPVDSGDYVATLDHQVVEEQIKLAQDDIDRTLSELEDSKMDSSLNLSNQRDAIVNARLDVNEKKITMDESIYESPSIQKKAKMDYDKAIRRLAQEKNAYILKKKQEENKVDRKYINYRQVADRHHDLEELYKSLVIRSPKAGILTYYKYPWGEIVKTGYKVGMYNSIIASIPDMSNLISRTYINEIDVSKVKAGQHVRIGIDAFPEKHLEGEVISVANVGQTMPNSDAKVFEVRIKIFGKDKDLKPAMTTSNTIEAGTYSDTLMVASDAVFENDSLKYVYVGRDNPVKQVVWLGDENENFVLVKKGLKEGDEVWLNEPANAENLKFAGLDIYREIKAEKEKAKAEADQERAQMDRQNPVGAPPAGVIQTKGSSVQSN